MISRPLLVSWVFLLALGPATAHVIDDTSLDADTMKEAEDTAKIAKEMVEEMSYLDKIHADSKLSIAKVVANLKEECRNESQNEVKKRLKKRKTKGGLRQFYQSLQHGKGDIQSYEKAREAIENAVCSACIIKKCERSKVHKELKIDKDLTKEEKIEICIRKILSTKPKPYKPNCDASDAFRTIDGTCNNLKNPSFGAVGTKFERVIDADYGDGISTLRLSVNQTALPNARDVSRFVHGSNADRTNPDSSILTHLTMNFGQFIDHDITLAEGQGLNCEPPTDDPECINIEIPPDDSTFIDREIDFIELERDAPHHEPASDCDPAPREHTNTITSYIDASNIYGSNKELADSLRNPDGTLKDMKHPAGCPFKNLLPPQTDGFCPSKDPIRPCFVTGDIRNNENQGLNSIHTIFVRHHNQIATFFGEKTLWDGERIYQETRKIIGAQLQVITYKEFLPLLLSRKRIEDFDLKLLEGKESFKGYDKTVNAQMLASFSVAAFRIGHSMVQELFKRFSQYGFEHRCDQCDVDKREFLPVPVLDFGNPTYLYDTCQGGTDSILTGLLKDPAGKVDGRFSSSVQENLMRGEGDLSDLMAINIERGRERGIPGYTSYRNLPLCGLKKVITWDDLEQIAGFDPEDVKTLRDIYDSVEDIDLFSGGVLEPRPLDGGVVGPTFQCFIAEQFRRLRIGDRFWYENEPNPELSTDNTAFTACQLQELRRTSLAKIMCDNSDGISAINRRALQLSEIRVPCDNLPRVILKPWLPGFKCVKDDNVYGDANNDDAEF